MSSTESMDIIRAFSQLACIQETIALIFRHEAEVFILRDLRNGTSKGLGNNLRPCQMDTTLQMLLPFDLSLGD